jgi:hypothetical protein
LFKNKFLRPILGPDRDEVTEYRFKIYRPVDRNIYCGVRIKKNWNEEACRTRKGNMRREFEVRETIWKTLA